MYETILAAFDRLLGIYDLQQGPLSRDCAAFSLRVEINGSVIRIMVLRGEITNTLRKSGISTDFLSIHPISR